MASKSDIKDIIALEPRNVALSQRDADQIPEHQSENDAVHLKFSSRSRRKAMIVVAAIVIIIIVIGVLLGTFLPNHFSNDDEDKQSTKGVGDREGSTSSSLRLRPTIINVSPSTKTSLAASTHQWQVRASTNQLQVAALTCSTCYDMSAKLSSSLKDIDAQYTGTESSISSIGQLVTNAALNTKLSFWTKISSTATHQSQVRASTYQLQVTASTCSTCNDVSTKLSSSVKDIDAQHTATGSSFSSISQLVTNAGTRSEVTSTHQWQVSALTYQLHDAALTCSTCYDMSTKSSPSLKDIDAQYTGTESSISSISQLVTDAATNTKLSSSEVSSTATHQTQVRVQTYRLQVATLTSRTCYRVSTSLKDIGARNIATGPISQSISQVVPNIGTRYDC